MPPQLREIFAVDASVLPAALAFTDAAVLATLRRRRFSSAHDKVKYVIKTAAPSRPQFDIERDLNPQQRAVVEAPAGRVLVIAGAGTGKTRTLTYRMARLVQTGCPPDRILLCTFTNRSAKEMVARVEALLAIDMRRCAAGTFHHIGNRILRRYGEAVGLSPDFGILDPEDAKTVLAAVVAEQGLEKLTARRFPNPKVLYGLISLASGCGQSLADVVAERANNFLPQLPTIEAVSQRYEERKRQLNVVDFDDLLLLWHRMLVDPKLRDVGEHLRSSYDHVLVDEYQDVSRMQGVICEEMAARSGSLTCVGDDAQSIYAFRGADFDQIAKFPERHPDALVLPLTINYRSTPEILELGNRSISHNRLGHDKRLQSVKPEGAKPALLPLRDVYQQAEFVAQRVLELHHEQNLPLRKMSVLYRNHSHSLELQVELSRRQIPYAVRSGMRFFEQAHIKDVVVYLRARENPRDALAWVRLLQQWPGVGAQSAERIADSLAAHTGMAAADELEAWGTKTKGRGGAALSRLASLWRVLSSESQRNPGAAIRAVVEGHYGDYIERTFTNAINRKDDIEHLAAYAERYPDPTAFLSELALVQGMSAEAVTASEMGDDKLVLSTIHQAKGLEWPICFVLGLADGRFPSSHCLRTPHELEEERRLFYVAVTRAADELYLCYPTLEDGKDGPSKLLRPSRFLTELDRPPAVFERWQVQEAPLTPEA